MFYSTFVKWDTTPVELEVKPGSKPFNARYYPVPRINNETFRKDLRRLVEIGVFTPVQKSQCGKPVFIIPKKEGTVRFITDYRNFNQKIFRNIYPLPRIGETIQKL